MTAKLVHCTKCDKIYDENIIQVFKSYSKLPTWVKEGGFKLCIPCSLRLAIWLGLKVVDPKEIEPEYVTLDEAVKRWQTE